MLTLHPSIGRSAPADETWPEMLSAPLAAFMDYWGALAASPPTPPLKRDFDLAAIPFLVPRLVIADADTPEPGRFRFRFMGSWHLLTFGRELTGCTVDQLDIDGRATGETADLRSSGGIGPIAATYKRIADTRAPHYWRRLSVYQGFCFAPYQRVMAPLLDDDGRVAALVGCFDLAED